MLACRVCRFAVIFQTLLCCRENFLTFTGACVHAGGEVGHNFYKETQSGPWLKKDKQRRTTVIYCRGVIKGISTPFGVFFIIQSMFCVSFFPPHILHPCFVRKMSLYTHIISYFYNDSIQYIFKYQRKNLSPLNQ